MKIWIFIFFGMLGTSGLWAQVPDQPLPPGGSSTTSTTSVGPGNPIPTNSTPMNISDPGVLFKRATDLANTIKPQSMELVSLFWVISLIYATWTSQISGGTQLVEPFIRVLIALALMDTFTDISQAILDGISQLGNSLTGLTGGNILGVSSIALGGGVAAALMTGGVSVVASLIGIVLGVFFIYIAIFAQILIKGLLISIAPLAIACIAFRHTSGIFTAWLKAFIAVSLIPLGWKIGAAMAGAMMKMDFGANNPLAQIGNSLGSAIMMIPMAIGVFFGMPAITLAIVNKAGGAAGFAFPSPIQQVAALVGTFASLRLGTAAGRAALGSAPQITEQLGSEVGRSVSGSHPAPRGETLYQRNFGEGGGSPVDDEMRTRILRAANIRASKAT